MRKNRLLNNRESSSTCLLVRISSHENNELKLEKDERLFEIRKDRLEKIDSELTAQSVVEEIPSRRARLNKASMKHAKLTKIS